MRWCSTPRVNREYRALTWPLPRNRANRGWLQRNRFEEEITTRGFGFRRLRRRSCWPWGAMPKARTFDLLILWNGGGFFAAADRARTAPDVRPFRPVRARNHRHQHRRAAALPRDGHGQRRPYGIGVAATASAGRATDCITAKKDGRVDAARADAATVARARADMVGGVENPLGAWAMHPGVDALSHRSRRRAGNHRPGGILPPSSASPMKTSPTSIAASGRYPADRERTRRLRRWGASCRQQPHVNA